jgi:hypothetical protein
VGRLSFASKWVGTAVVAEVLLLTTVMTGCSAGIDSAHRKRAHTLGAEVYKTASRDAAFRSTYPLDERELRKTVLEVCRVRTGGHSLGEVADPCGYAGWWTLSDNSTVGPCGGVCLRVSTGVSTLMPEALLVIQKESGSAWTPQDCDVVCSLLADIRRGMIVDPTTPMKKTFTGPLWFDEGTSPVVIGVNTRVISVDGTVLLPTARVLRLPPGRHVVMAEFSADFYSDSGPGGNPGVLVATLRSAEPLRLEIEVQPGHSYAALGVCEGDFPAGAARVEVSDSFSGEVVAKARGKIKETTERSS